MTLSCLLHIYVVLINLHTLLMTKILYFSLSHYFTSYYTFMRTGVINLLLISLKSLSDYAIFIQMTTELCKCTLKILFSTWQFDVLIAILFFTVLATLKLTSTAVWYFRFFLTIQNTASQINIVTLSQTWYVSKSILFF